MWPIAELVPHAGNMILLERIAHFDEDTLVAYCTVRKDGIYSQADGSYPAYLGIEIMSQCIAAYAGLKAKQAGEPVRLGFLLGTRKYESNTDRFPLGSELRTSVTRTLDDDSGMGVFECELSSEQLLLRARLNVYRPNNVEEYIQEKTL